MTAPIGTVPLVSPFAHVIMSGITSKYCAAKGAPNLPNPVITSSKMSKISYSVQISLTRSKYPFGGINTPVEPAMGSVIKAAIWSAPCFSITRSKSSASSLPQIG